MYTLDFQIRLKGLQNKDTEMYKINKYTKVMKMERISSTEILVAIYENKMHHGVRKLKL
jgi:hypothetical protein